MTTDLATWLLEQIEEDDSKVRGAGRPSILGLPRRFLEGRVWLPMRVRDECAARRRIVQMYQAATVDSPDGPGGEMWQAMQRAERSALLDVLRHLAQPYADRPGFDEAVSTPQLRNP
jgi:hypothetical protein